MSLYRRTKCEKCGQEIITPLVCRYCGGDFCSEHHLPPKHGCPQINLWRLKHQPDLVSKHMEEVIKPIFIEADMKKFQEMENEYRKLANFTSQSKIDLDPILEVLINAEVHQPKEIGRIHTGGLMEIREKGGQRLSITAKLLLGKETMLPIILREMEDVLREKLNRPIVISTSPNKISMQIEPVSITKDTVDNLLEEIKNRILQELEVR